MLTTRVRLWLGGIALAALAAGAVVACDLNPQPLPPGAAPSGGDFGNSGADGSVTNNPAPIMNDDGGTGSGLNGDGGVSSDAAPPTASDDAGDASIEDGGDAAIDGSAEDGGDAGDLDAGEEGG